MRRSLFVLALAVSVSDRLKRNGFTPPASCTSSCDEVWMSADTTITLASGSSSRSFVSTSSPYIPFITRSSMTMFGFSMK